MHSQLNQQQKHVFDTIISKFESDPRNSQFFLQGPVGTGKTFVYNTLCNYYKSKNEIVLCVASSGIAALLLPDGQTSHSLFKIPLSIDECFTCSIRKDSDLAGPTQRANLIIWDEVPMQHKYCFEAVHRTFQDICDDLEELYLLGGEPVVLDGDSAQIPLVVRRVISLAKASSLETHPEHAPKSFLNENDIAFARFLADVFYSSSLQGNIVLPSFIHQTTQLAEFISRIYKDEDIRRPNLSSQVYFGERVILASRNDTVNTISMAVLEKTPGEKVTLLSTDSADINDADGLHTIPTEYLQSVNPSGLPPSQLELKVGAPVMLLRNIDPVRGLCNGTRLIVMHIGQYMLRVRLANKLDAPIELIPRFTLSALEDNMSFMLTRKQFSVKLCFAMTINKSQGQSLEYVGIDLRRPPCMHG
ncbi:hypothetical protein RMATCC62417_11344 [Rhizopus microsporus]|nr:hypothetical protein RMATCC62417_11344 [Rhizopus microsporus]